ncbi:MAG TPA: hypothetical protein VFT65_00205, partial [Candidatus Angelobacter sp.]|nr:hypothetical protein [Candidatus Angelobacter sp.]
MKSIITFCAVIMLAATAGADTIVLKNGDRIRADSAQERNGRVEYTIGDNTMTIPKSIVVRIEKGGAPLTSAPSSPSSATIEPPTHEEMTVPGDLVTRIIHDGAVDTAAVKAIESESGPLQSAAANSIAANFEEKRNNYPAAARYLQAALAYLPDHPV